MSSISLKDIINFMDSSWSWNKHCNRGKQYWRPLGYSSCKMNFITSFLFCKKIKTTRMAVSAFQWARLLIYMYTCNIHVHVYLYTCTCIYTCIHIYTCKYTFTDIYIDTDNHYVSRKSPAIFHIMRMVCTTLMWPDGWREWPGVCMCEQWRLHCTSQ